MRLDIRYVRQRTDFDCGPASLGMIAAFWRRRVSVSEMRRTLGTSAEHGTTRRAMVRGARSLGLEARARCGGSLDDIRRLLRRGIPVVVNYRIPDGEESHFAVISGTLSGRLLLHDPILGPYRPIKDADFLKRWYGRHVRRHRRWLMAASPQGALLDL